ncbi:hypothetical protein M9Y10_028695 [Tritrichomonas musculus]|uniref:Cyclic nucleotide-binding domain-containing protein n=1 Tax=Tritrichomonas musculus TaxID=1915356 RepID=A0ABR2KL65_9EUKA
MHDTYNYINRAEAQPKKFYSTQPYTKLAVFLNDGSRSFYSHFNQVRRFWEYLIMFLSLVVPMEMLFVALIVPNIKIYTYSYTFIFDILFAIDIYIVCNTSILYNGEVLTKPKKIAKVYGIWALVIQLISCIPLGWIGIIMHNRIAYVLFSINRLLRLHRGYRAYRNSKTLLPYIGGPLSILPVLYFLVFAIDIFATIFIVIAELQGFNESWLAPFHQRGFSKIQCFFVSIYFVMTTILTIGFGDISPITTAEVIITIFVQLIGVSMEALMTSMMVAILTDPISADFVQNYKVTMDFLKLKKVDSGTRIAVHNYYQYMFERTDCTGNMKHALKSLPDSLRSTIKLEMTKNFFVQTKSFISLSNKQLIQIVDVMSFKTFSPHDVITVQGEQRDRIFFFGSGILAVIEDGRCTMSKSCKTGFVDGELDTFLKKFNKNGLVALTYVEAWVLRLDDIVQLMQDKEDIRFLMLNELFKIYENSPQDFQLILCNTVPDQALRKNVDEIIHNNNRHIDDE